MKKTISIKDWVALLIGVLMLVYVVLQFVPTYTYMATVSHSRVKKVAAVVDKETGEVITPEIPEIPKWSENVVAKTSIFSYLALPSDYTALTDILKEEYAAEKLTYDINGVVGICLLLQFLAIAGFILNLLAQKSIFSPIAGIVWGALGVYGYVTNLFLKLGGDFRTVGDVFTHTNPDPAVNETTSIVVGKLAEGAETPAGNVIVSAIETGAPIIYTTCIVLFCVVGVLSAYRLAQWIVNRGKERDAYNQEMLQKQAALDAERAKA